MNYLKNILKYRESSLGLIILLFIIILSTTTDSFLTKINLYGIMYYLTENTIIIGAITLIIVSGNFDLSVGSLLGFSGILVGVLMQNLGLPIPVAIVITLLTGVFIGMINGVIISYVGINLFITTLASWFVLLSLKYIINNGNHVSNLSNEFRLISRYKIYGIPLMVYIAIAIMIIFLILLKKTKYFRQNYYIGGNKKAAELVGINVKKIITINYMLVGLSAATAGMLTAARFRNAYTSAGTETAFIAIIAVIIGGASLYGGKGSVLGSFFGLIFISLVYNAIILYGINLNWNLLALGILIIVAVTIDVILEKKKNSSL